MKKIASFTINHLRLHPGVYESRVDTWPSGEQATTFDLRMTAPNRMPALSPVALHAMEHIAATFLRNHKTWGPRIVYWGPMGCCTGNYLIVKGHPSTDEIRRLMVETMEAVAGWDAPVPGATPRDCGNYLFMNLPEARMAAETYLHVLRSPSCPTEYPSEDAEEI